MARTILVQLVRYTHLAIVLFVLIGWLSPFASLLKAHLILIPVLILQWQINSGTCYLTNLENWLLQKEKIPKEQQGQFIKTLLSRFYDPLPSDANIKRGLYAILAISFSLSALRLYNPIF